MIKLIYEGIEFFQAYYKNELLLSLTLAMIGWIALLYQYLIRSKISLHLDTKSFLVGFILIIVIVIYNILQHTPPIVLGYFLLPIIIWMIVIANNETKILQNFIENSNHVLIASLCIAFAELLVFAFFERKILSIVLMVYSGSITAFVIRKKWEPKLKALKYFSSAVCLGIFPLLKVIDKDTKNSILL
jgi:GPI ethanolamine phosphate transferase 1